MIKSSQIKLILFSKQICGSHEDEKVASESEKYFKFLDFKKQNTCCFKKDIKELTFRLKKIQGVINQ